MQAAKICKKDVDSLLHLGMRCLVMTSGGEAFANEFMLKLNEENKAWMQKEGYNPFSSSLMPKKLNNYCNEWKESLIDLCNYEY